MTNKNAIILVIDRLSAGMLGPYGNTWLETPHLNQLASQSLLFDFAVSDSTLLERTYRSYWSGLHAAVPSDPRSGERSLSELLSHRGIASTLITDDDEVDRCVSVERHLSSLVLPAQRREESAQEIEDTSLGTITAAAISEIEELAGGQLIWIHAAGMKAAWDAPLQLRNALADEEDPIPPTFVDPPATMLATDSDPDELLGVTQAYGGQVALLDICVGALVDAIDACCNEETLFILTSPRGFPLGEHRRVGAYDSSLYNESLAVPLILRVANNELGGQRSQALVQPPDLFETLLGWFEVSRKPAVQFGTDLIALARGEASLNRDRACSIGQSECALRTPAWFLRDANDDLELYAKPDDRWEMNNVVQRCPSVAQEMQIALADYQKWLASGLTEPLLELSDELLYGVE